MEVNQKAPPPYSLLPPSRSILFRQTETRAREDVYIAHSRMNVHPERGILFTGEGLRLGNPEDRFFVCSIYYTHLVWSILIIISQGKDAKGKIFQCLKHFPPEISSLEEMIQYDEELGPTITVIGTLLQPSFPFITYFLVERNTFRTWRPNPGPPLAQRIKESLTAFKFRSKISSASRPNSSQEHAHPQSTSEDTRRSSAAKTVSAV